MDALRLVFVQERYNKHGIAVLAGVMDDAGIPGVRPVFAKGKCLPAAAHACCGRCKLLVLAFSFHTADAPGVNGMVLQVRRVLRDMRQPAALVAGGTHASGDPEATLAMGFDIAVRGEGESVFPALVKRIAEGRDWRDLPGVSYFDRGVFRANPPGPHVDLDAHPPFAAERRLFAPIEITRGCPWGCRFCQATYMMGGRPRHRSVERVVHHLEAMKARGLRDLRFVTPDAFSYGSPGGRSPEPAAVERLLLEAGKVFGRDHVWFGSFPSEVRPEHVTGELADVVKRLAANDNVVIGAQSGSDRLLLDLRRGHVVDDVFRASEILLKRSFKVYVDFIAGLPGETGEDLALTLGAMKKLVGMGAFVHAHTFMPLPGTPLAGSQPGKVDGQFRRGLEKLSGTGLFFGRWERQERLAARIERFRESLLADPFVSDFADAS